MEHSPDPSWCARLRAASPPAPEPAAAPSLEPTPAAKPLPRGNPYTYRATPTRHDCEMCGAAMYDHSCKIVCPNCGYKRDCSDP